MCCRRRRRRLVSSSSFPPAQAFRLLSATLSRRWLYSSFTGSLALISLRPRSLLLLSALRVVVCPALPIYLSIYFLDLSLTIFLLLGCVFLPSASLRTRKYSSLFHLCVPLTTPIFHLFQPPNLLSQSAQPCRAFTLQSSHTSLFLLSSSRVTSHHRNGRQQRNLRASVLHAALHGRHVWSAARLREWQRPGLVPAAAARPQHPSEQQPSSHGHV